MTPLAGETLEQAETSGNLLPMRVVGLPTEMVSTGSCSTATLSLELLPLLPLLLMPLAVRGKPSCARCAGAPMAVALLSPGPARCAA